MLFRGNPQARDENPSRARHIDASIVGVYGVLWLKRRRVFVPTSLRDAASGERTWEKDSEQQKGLRDDGHT